MTQILLHSVIECLLSKLIKVLKISEIIAKFCSNQLSASVRPVFVVEEWTSTVRYVGWDFSKRMVLWSRAIFPDGAGLAANLKIPKLRTSDDPKPNNSYGSIDIYPCSSIVFRSVLQWLSLQTWRLPWSQHGFQYRFFEQARRRVFKKPITIIHLWR